VPVQLQIGKGPGAVRRRLDEFAPAGKVEFTFDFDEKLQEHLESAEIGPGCGGPSLLCNGDFSQPPPADATRRLFGFDSRQSWEIVGNVDLSRGINLTVERFLTISVDAGSPRRIDCAGAAPERTSLSEIIQAINRGLGASIAAEATMVDSSGLSTGTGRLYLVSPQGDGGEVTLHLWCQRGLPDCWQGSADLLQRIRRRREVGSETILLLANPNLVPALTSNFDFNKNPIPLACSAAPGLGVTASGGALLGQRLAVAAECSYRLGIVYSVIAAKEGGPGCQPSSLAAPSWELQWFDAAGTALGQQGGKLATEAVDRNTPAAGPVDERLQAPPGATAAELRLLHPAASGYGLVVAGVHFEPTPEAVVNGDFSQWQGPFGAQTPANWTVQSGWLELGGAPWENDGVRLLGTGDAPEDAVLTQTVAVKGGVDYELLVRARLLPSGSLEDANRPLAQRPRLELRWLAEAPLGEAVILPLDGPGFSGRALAATAPAGATGAELKLVQPLDQGLDLLVEQVQLTKSERVEVPLIFLGEAPGQLKVNDLRVAYDLPAPADGPQGASLQRVMALRSLAVERSSLALADRPAAIVAGVGKRYTAILAQQPKPITTVGQLARLDPTSAIPGIFLERRLEIKAAAETILDLGAELAAFTSLYQESVMTLLTSPPEVVARQGGLATEQVRALQKKLRTQHLLLNNKALHGMTLADLAAPKRIG